MNGKIRTLVTIVMAMAAAGAAAQFPGGGGGTGGGGGRPGGAGSAGRSALPELKMAPEKVPIPVADQVQIQAPLDLSGSSIVLDDDYNPLDLWSVDAAEKWRAAAIAMYPHEVLFAE